MLSKSIQQGGRMWWMINTKGMNYILSWRTTKKCELGHILCRLKIWMLTTIREIIRFLNKIPLFPAEMIGTKILNLAEEWIWAKEFPKATYTATQARKSQMVDSRTQRIWMVILGYRIGAYWVPAWSFILTSTFNLFLPPS